MIAFVISVIVQTFPTIEAELLLREVEAKIASANTLRIEFTMTLRNGEVAGFQGTLLLAQKNRARLEYKTKDAKGKTKSGILALSDGKELVQEEVSEQEGKRLNHTRMPSWYNAILQSRLGRGGAFQTEISIQPSNLSTGTKPEAKDGPRTSNVKQLPDETMNGVKARVVEYDLEWPAVPDEFQKWKVRFWIDAKTKLPLRRTMIALAKADGTATVTETKFEVDPKLDEKLFQLPGKKYSGDEARIQGLWDVISWTENGKVSPGGEKDPLRLEFDAKTLRFWLPGPAGRPEPYRLDPAKSPKTIDLLPGKNAGRLKPVLGIYELDGDSLKICLDPEGKERPAGFLLPKGKEYWLLILKRVNNDVEEKPK